MRNILLIAKREYLERVRSRSFVIMTFLIPALMIGVSVVPMMMATRGTNETKNMVIVSPDRQTAESIRSNIEQEQDQKQNSQPTSGKRSLPPTHFTVEIDTSATQAERTALTEKVKNKQLDGFLWATPDAIAAHKLDFVTRDVSSFIDNGVLGQIVSDALTHDALKSKGMKEEDINAALEPVKVEAQSPLGKGAPNPETMFFATLTLTMVMYVTVLLYGVNVMRSILEEKTSRIMEVMLSTATSKEMMAGKILGVGAVGLTQVGIWAAAAGVYVSGSLAAAGSLKKVLNPVLLIYFVVFFLLGYVLYSALCAAVGSMVNSDQEAQQMQMLVMMPLILAVLFIASIFQHPSSPIAVFGSLFPFTSPLVMFSRIAMQTPPWWQIAISIALLVITIYAMVWLSGRIYRVGILMYGKKPTLPEILKWIKYA